jgi:hypothetical protein
MMEQIRTAKNYTRRKKINSGICFFSKLNCQTFQQNGGESAWKKKM